MVMMNINSHEYFELAKTIIKKVANLTWLWIPNPELCYEAERRVDTVL